MPHELPDELSPETLAVVAGRDRSPGAPANQPPVLASTFREGGESLYTRLGNPTWTAFEETLGTLEGGRCLAYASGMAAAVTILDGLQPGAKVVAPSTSYLGVRDVLREFKEAGQLDVQLVDISDTNAASDAASDAAMLWIESPTNPMLDIADIERLSTGAHEAGATVVVDNTFATPMLQRPLDLGADIVMHSVTKFISGHSDLVMGALVTRADNIFEKCELHRKHRGAIPGPFEVYLALRGLRTLPLRLEKGQASARLLAARLQEHPAVHRVIYPGLPDHPGYELCAKQMEGPGAMISFEVADAGAADKTCERTGLIAHMTSLGGIETTMERRTRWAGEESTPEGLIRMSVGCENVEDLWRDLNQALG
ncbi:MAG: trans-sulfuration enzyme family protein [Actinomycetota bacterium]